MQNNPEIEKIVNNAVAIAKAHNHAYVITEHVLMAMIQHAPFRALLVKYGTAVEQFEGERVPGTDTMLGEHDGEAFDVGGQFAIGPAAIGHRVDHGG